jgi:hypothetical protein
MLSKKAAHNAMTRKFIFMEGDASAKIGGFVLEISKS